jgi:hypothetical protein
LGRFEFPPLGKAADVDSNFSTQMELFMAFKFDGFSKAESGFVGTFPILLLISLTLLSDDKEKSRFCIYYAYPYVPPPTPVIKHPNSLSPRSLFPPTSTKPPPITEDLLLSPL